MAHREYEQLYIDGKWVHPQSNDVLQVISPSSETVVGRAPDASPADIDHAVRAARTAFDAGEWSELGMQQRAKFLQKIAHGVAARGDELSQVIASESGLPIKMWARVEPALLFLDYYLGLAERYELEELRTGPTSRVLVRHEPVGVVGAILPWNSPIGIAFMKLVPALLAGCTVVFKPDPNTPLHACVLAEICHEAGLPPGVFNVVPAGREGSEALVRHPDVDKISFTGSTATGRVIGRLCGEQLKRCTLELGGKSAAILLDDVDLSATLPMLAGSAFMNNGEACVLQSRVLAPRSRYDEVVGALTHAATGMRVGDALDPQTDVGPMITAAHRDRVEGFIARGVQEGAQVAVGGERPDIERGWYVVPTVLAGVDNSMEVAQQEIFGPVVAVIPYADEREAVALANDTSFGLSGTVWTKDHARGMSIAEKIRTGNYGINTFGMDPCAPFGGRKESGLGCELGPEGLTEFLDTKSIHLPQDWDARAYADRR